MFTVRSAGEDIFIVTKLPPKGNRPEGVRKYIQNSLKELQVDYIDVYLIHGPFGFNDVEGQLFPVKEDGSADLDMTTDHVAIWKVARVLSRKRYFKTILNVLLGNGKTSGCWTYESYRTL